MILSYYNKKLFFKKVSREITTPVLFLLLFLWPWMSFAAPADTLLQANPAPGFSLDPHAQKIKNNSPPTHVLDHDLGFTMTSADREAQAYFDERLRARNFGNINIPNDVSSHSVVFVDNEYGSPQDKSVDGSDCTSDYDPGQCFSGFENASLRQIGDVVSEALQELPKCCETVALSDIYFENTEDNELGNPAKDPYVLGSPDVHPNDFYGDVKMQWKTKPFYRFIPFGESDLIGETVIEEDVYFKIPRKLPGEENEKYLRRRLQKYYSKKGYTYLNERLTFVGKGLSSQVFFFHEPYPPESQLLADYPSSVLDQRFGNNRSSDVKDLDRRKKLWAEANSMSVVKVRNHKSHLLLRDLALARLYRQLAAKFKFINSAREEERLIDFAPYEFSLSELKQGLIRQPAVVGPTAATLSNIVLRGENMTADERQYLVSQFGSVEEARRKLQAISIFYHLTKPYVDEYSFKNEFSGGIWGTTFERESGSSSQLNRHRMVSIGFDLAHGHNLAWDANKKIFVCFDP